MKKSRIFQQIIYWPTFLILRIFFRFKVFGQRNLRRLEKKPVIFVSNHITLIDGFFCAASMPRCRLFPTDFFPIKFLVTELYCDRRKTPFHFPLSLIIWLFLKLNEVISVPEINSHKRNRAEMINNLKTTAEIVQKNSAKIWIFPEGRRNQYEMKKD